MLSELLPREIDEASSLAIKSFKSLSSIRDLRADPRWLMEISLRSLSLEMFESGSREDLTNTKPAACREGKNKM